MKALVWTISILLIHTMIAMEDTAAELSPEGRAYVGYVFHGVLGAVAEGAAKIASKKRREIEEEMAWQREQDAMVDAARREIEEGNRRVQAHFDRANEHDARADEALERAEAANAKADVHIARAEELNRQIIDELQAFGADLDHTQKVVREANAHFKSSMHRDGLMTKVAPGAVIALIVGYKLAHYLLVQPAEGCP